jgi:hypothetical protein
MQANSAKRGLQCIALGGVVIKERAVRIEEQPS